MSELSPQARALLREAAAGDEPTGEDRSRLRAAVFATVGLPVPSAGIGGGGAAAASGKVGAAGAAQAAVAGKAAGWLGWKVLTTILVVGGVGTGVAVQHYRSQPDASAVVSLEVAQAPGERAEANAAPTEKPSAVEADALEPVLSDEPVGAATPPAPARRPTKKPSAPSAVAPEPDPQPEPIAEPQHKRATTAGDLREEHRLLSSARAALRRGEASSALESLREHRTSFPKGALGQERDLLSVLALCGSGNKSRAQALADRFRRKYPNSPLARRLDSSCVGTSE